MKKLLLSSLLVLSLMLTVTGCRKPVPIYQPTFQVQAKSSAQVGQAVKKVLQRRRWVIENTGSNYYIVRYDRGAEISATVRIDYSADRVSTVLVKSKNLKHMKTNEGETIHQTFNNWMHNLERDIELELSYM